MGEASAITDFSETTICDLLSTFAANTYHADKDNKKNPYIDAVILLIEKDYKIAKLDNTSGNLAFHYPSIIPIIESSRHVTTIYENKENDAPSLNIKKLAELCEKAKLARCRQRFPVPVIYFRGHHICRSATLASVPEICYRGNYAFNGIEFLRAVSEFLWPSEESPPEVASEEAGKYENKLPDYCNNIRNNDLNLLKALNVYNIVDIMVETRKVKHGLYVSASEKVDRERYKDFRLLSLPYPGCEFFVQFNNSLLKPESLYYNWDNPSNNAELTVPHDNIHKKLQISWERFKNWDVIYLTKNYLKYIIKRLQEDNCGLLLHCISGWDRTPLFISILRLSLWADGLVHENLNEYEILFLTLAYDWYLFGHHLSNRIHKNEEIMAFAFEMLKHITSEEFSSKPPKKRLSEEASISSTSSKSFTLDESSESPKKRLSEEGTTTSSGIGMDTVKLSKIHLSDETTTTGSPATTVTVVEPLDHSKKRLSSGSEGSFFTLEDLEPRDTIPTTNPFLSERNGFNGREHTKQDNTSGSAKSSGTPEKDVSNGADGTTKSPTSGLISLKTSPLSIKGASNRQRTSSTGSTGSWVMINECGSLEQDHSLKPIRQYKLEKVRTIFMSCYQKSIKLDTYGPPKSMVEETVVNIYKMLVNPSGLEE